MGRYFGADEQLGALGGFGGKAGLNGRSRLVGYNALQCFAIELDTISSRPMIVYP